jgi:hypothetical protein
MIADKHPAAADLKSQNVHPPDLYIAKEVKKSFDCEVTASESVFFQ